MSHNVKTKMFSSSVCAIRMMLIFTTSIFTTSSAASLQWKNEFPIETTVNDYEPQRPQCPRTQEKM